MKPRRIKHPIIRAARAALVGFDGKRIAIVTMVVDDRLPEVVMFEGEPFLTTPTSPTDVSATYMQAHAYRADAMVIEEGAI